MDGAMSIRVFTAIEIDDAIRKRLTELQDALQPLSSDVKWVEPHNVHLTLAFIGDVPDAMVPSLNALLDQAAAAAAAPFDCALAGLGTFGRPNAPRVIWAGAPTVPAPLAAIHRTLTTGLHDLGLAIDTRPYAPHLTLGRVKSSRGLTELLTELGRLTDTPIGTLHVERLTLIQSILKPTGPIYAPLQHAPIKPTSGSTS